MKRILLLIIAIQLSTAYAQQYIEVGVFAGVSNYQGDLAPVAFVPKETHPAFGAFYKFNFNYWFAFKGSIYSGFISGNDDNSTEEWKQERNLSFVSNVQEVSVFFELFLKKYNPNYRWNILSPYVFIGFAGYHFNPMANYNGVWYELQPLGTEGQGNPYYPDRKPYSLTQYAIPMGMGFKGSITKDWNLGIEIGYRKTSTDYLDDVSTTYVAKEILLAGNGDLAWQLSNRTDEMNGGIPIDRDDHKYRGDDTNKDWYIFSGVTLSRNIETKSWDKDKYKVSTNKKKPGLRASKKKADCPGIRKSFKKNKKIGNKTLFHRR
ncbi:MAG: DUF6089 family protein [Chitinophagales bacterium]